MNTTTTPLYGIGPSEDDQPLVTTGKPLDLPTGITVDLDTTKWYYLKASYVDDYGKLVSGFAYPVGTNAADSFWDYVVFNKGGAGTAALKFKLETPDKDGWQQWTIHDDARNEGYHLSCKATGWLYRATGYDVKFRIVDRHLYCSYWGGPVGSTFRSFLVSSGQYLGMGLPAFTCELQLVE
jgi:hypothetical protein